MPVHKETGLTVFSGSQVFVVRLLLDRLLRSGIKILWFPILSLMSDEREVLTVWRDSN